MNEQSHTEIFIVDPHHKYRDILHKVEDNFGLASAQKVRGLFNAKDVEGAFALIGKLYMKEKSE